MKGRCRLQVLFLAGFLLLTACNSSRPEREYSAPPVYSRSESVGIPEPERIVELNFAGTTSDSANEAATLWKEIVERESDGTIRVNLYPDNMLADDTVAIQTTIAGDIDIATTSTSPMCVMYPDFYLFDAPYLFLHREDVYEVLDGSIGDTLLAGLEGLGLKGLMFWENGFRQMSNDIVPVSSPSDIAGLRIRVMENDVHQAAWQAFGATPVAMPFQNVFSAMEQGTIDAQENSLGVIYSNQFQDINRYISLTQHVYTPYVIVMNLDRWNTLTDRQKAALEKANQEATQFQRSYSQEVEETTLRFFESEGVDVIHLSEEGLASFQQAISDNNIFELVKEKMDHPDYLDQVVEATLTHDHLPPTNLTPPPAPPS